MRAILGTLVLALLTSCAPGTKPAANQTIGSDVATPSATVAAQPSPTVRPDVVTAASPTTAPASTATRPPAATNTTAPAPTATRPPAPPTVTPALNRAGAAPVNRTDCPPDYPIKANQSGIYHVPGGGSYRVTTPVKCYATEADAQAGGYRRAQN